MSAKRITAYEAMQMMNAAIADAWSSENIALLARSILAKVDRQTAIQLFHPGSVIADTYDGNAHTATVNMDGSGLTGPATPTNCYVLIPQVLFPGTRVMVWYDAPHVAYIIGTIGLLVPPGLRASIPCSSDAPVFVADETKAPLDWGCVEDLAGGMTVDSTIQVATVPIDGIYRSRVSGTFTFTTPGRFTLAVGSTSQDPDLSVNVGVISADGSCAVVVLRMALRAGAQVQVNAFTSLGGAGFLEDAVWELEYASVFQDQIGCDCTCG